MHAEQSLVARHVVYDLTIVCDRLCVVGQQRRDSNLIGQHLQARTWNTGAIHRSPISFCCIALYPSGFSQDTAVAIKHDDNTMTT
jgi:hypothetical protein